MKNILKCIRDLLFTGATMNLSQRITTVGVQNLIAFFVILLHGETYGKYLEVRL